MYSKAHNHLFWPNFKYVNLFYQQNIYIPNINHIPNINLTKFEPLKPSCSEDINLLVCEAAILFGQKCVFHQQNTSSVYFDINLSGFTPVYRNVISRS